MKSRNFVFTWNNYTEADEAYLRSLEGVRYCCYGREYAPTTGTPHLQGYLSFWSPRSFDATVKLLRANHVEVAKTTEEAIAYCKKIPDWVEWGDVPVSRKRKGEMEKERWEEARKKAKTGDFEGIDADIYIRYKRTLETIHSESHVPEDRVTLENHWFCGPTGCGKSKLAWERWPDAYHKDPMTRWWDGYKGQDVVIIDDFDVYQKAQGGDMKRWADHYAFPAPVKGGYINIRPKVIVVTSNYTPEEIWEDEQTREPILRRFNVERMGPAAKPFVEHFKKM